MDSLESFSSSSGKKGTITCCPAEQDREINLVKNALFFITLRKKAQEGETVILPV